MIVLLTFAFLSGLVTILAPCIWPLLPIILSSSATGGKRKPLGITLGILVSFAFFTLTLSYIVKIIPLDPDALRLLAVVVIGFLGLTLIIPKLAQTVEGLVSQLSNKLGVRPNAQNQGFWGGFLTGAALGIVWTPCAGPILATIATLAATRAVNFEIVLVTIVYVIGVGIPLFVFALLGQRIFTGSRRLSPFTGRIQQVFGVIMIATALLIATNYDKVLQAKLLDAVPAYSQFIYDLEGQTGVTQELDRLTDKTTQAKDGVNIDMFDPMKVLPNYGKAPEFIGITNWLNSEPLKMADLKGKVVLIDFWTYTCINCIRTLPYVTGWYEKYKDEGLVVVGVHTPEFEFEKKTENVEDAMRQYKITYPVAQDNNYRTWDNYNNRYWPAKYLIDAEGNIRYTHFGEGEYETTEKNIQKLLEEAGKRVEAQTLEGEDQTPRGRITPETYLGSLRMDRFASVEKVEGGTQKFTPSNGLPDHYFAFAGTWDVRDEYSASSKGSALDLHFIAKKVFLVITPVGGDKITVKLDGRTIDQLSAGKDVQNGVIKIDKARLYELVDLDQVEDHVLRLEFQTPGTQIFAFTFG